MIDWYQRSRYLFYKADETNDIHDHDEIHAAATVCFDIFNGTYVDPNDYVTRWIEGLLNKPVKNSVPPPLPKRDDRPGHNTYRSGLGGSGLFG